MMVAFGDDVVSLQAHALDTHDIPESQISGDMTRGSQIGPLVLSHVSLCCAIPIQRFKIIFSYQQLPKPIVI